MSNLKFEHELKHRIAPSSMSGHTELNEPKEGNKVIGPKSRASTFSKQVRQTDRQTFFSQKDV